MPFLRLNCLNVSQSISQSDAHSGVVPIVRPDRVSQSFPEMLGMLARPIIRSLSRQPPVHTLVPRSSPNVKMNPLLLDNDVVRLK